MSEWSLVVCGDCAPTDSATAAVAADPQNYFGDSLSVLRDTDLALVNVEGVISDDQFTPIIKDGINIQLPTALAAGLKAVPFHVACLANNHSFDFGQPGLSATMRNLSEHGISAIGAGLTREDAEAPGIFHFGETSLAIINAAEGEECNFENHNAGAAPFDLGLLSRQITNLKQSVDIVILIVHAGREHLPVPAPYIRSAFHALIDAGADAVIGHHPHVSQGIEYYKDAPIAYSLGNFMMWMDGPMETHRVGYFLKIHFKGKERQKIDLWPYHIDEHHIRLHTISEKDEFLDNLSQTSQWITSDSRLAEIWEAYADRWLQAQGIHEMLDNSIRLAGMRRTVISLLKSKTSGGRSQRKLRILADILLWRIIHLLEHKVKPAFWERPQAFNAAAILRNRFDTQAHKEVYLTALQRIVEGKTGTAPAWAYKLMDDWKISEYLQTE